MAEPNECQSDGKHTPETHLSSVLGTLMRSPKFSDLEFVCEGQGIKVHKAIVCTQSSVIDKSANHEFFVEGQTGRIEMTNFDLPTVKRMVEFMYTGDYSVTTEDNGLDTSETPNPDDSEEAECTANLEIIKRHVRVNAIADYYDIPSLQRLSSSRIEDTFDEIPFHTDVLLGVLKEVQEKTGDRELYQILASAAANHLGEVLNDNNFGALGIMKDEFGRRLIFECARLIAASTDSLKAERKLFKRAMCEIERLQNKIKEYDSEIESFTEKAKGQKVCQNCSNNLGCTVTWTTWSTPQRLFLCCRKCNHDQ